jgi:2-dehydro-3-deoxyphosphogluconate aldolase/(4S)-4-hydroxy-2-oxoglutarate aldolase
MTKKEVSTKILLQQKLLPLYYHDSIEVSISIMNALYEAGIKIIEYTNRGDAAIENFKLLRKAVDDNFDDFQLGIGTIKTPHQAQMFIDAGADFVICPSMNIEVAKICQAIELLWIPGCMTATEIADAENAGAEIVKIFPGNLLGPSYITSIQSIFPQIKFIVTGGIEPSEQHIIEWFQAGAVGLGMGSTLITKNILETKNYTALTTATMVALKMVRLA